MSTGHTSFKLTCDYHFWVSYKKYNDLYSKSKSVDTLLAKLQELMIVCQKTSIIGKRFRKKLIRLELSPEVIPWEIKFGEILNRSKPNRTKSKR